MAADGPESSQGSFRRIRIATADSRRDAVEYVVGYGVVFLTTLLGLAVIALGFCGVYDISGGRQIAVAALGVGLIFPLWWIAVSPGRRKARSRLEQLALHLPGDVWAFHLQRHDRRRFASIAAAAPEIVREPGRTGLAFVSLSGAALQFWSDRGDHLQEFARFSSDHIRTVGQPQDSSFVQIAVALPGQELIPFGLDLSRGRGLSRTVRDREQAMTTFKAWAQGVVARADLE